MEAAADESAKKLAANVRAIRAYRNLSTRDIAARGGPSASTVSRIENEDRDCTLRSMTRLAYALDLPSVAHLFYNLELVRYTTPDPETEP